MRNRVIVPSGGAAAPPIEVEIGGQVFHAKRMTRPLWVELRRAEQRIKEGDFSAFYDQVGILVDCPQEVVDSLDVDQVKAVVEGVIDLLTNPSKGMDEAEKKASEPGVTPPPPSPTPSQGSSTPGSSTT